MVKKAPEQESVNDRKCANVKFDDHRQTVKYDDHRPARGLSCPILSTLSKYRSVGTARYFNNNILFFLLLLLFFSSDMSGKGLIETATPKIKKKNC